MNENRPVSSVFIIHLCKLLNTSSGSNRSFKVDTVGFRAVGAAFMSQLSSSGYKCCTERSMTDLGVRSFAPGTTPSQPVITSITTPNFHWAQFFSSDLMITRSPSAGWILSPLCLRQCLSQSPPRYSLVQRDHTASLHLPRYFPRFRRSWMWFGSNSGSVFGCTCNNELGVRIGSSMSSST